MNDRSMPNHKLLSECNAEYANQCLKDIGSAYKNFYDSWYVMPDGRFTFVGDLDLAYKRIKSAESEFKNALDVLKLSVQENSN